MSGSQHTPGPWVVDDRPTYDEAAGLHAKPIQRGAFIATVETAWGFHSIHAPATIGQPCPSTVEMDAQGLANAHLIAAAPELMDCCIRALAAWTGSGPSIVLDDLRAAIAKAEGR